MTEYCLTILSFIIRFVLTSSKVIKCTKLHLFEDGAVAISSANTLFIRI